MVIDTRLEEHDPDTPPKEQRFRRRRQVAVLGVVALLVAGCLAWTWWPERKADIRAGTTLVTTQGMAARYGIKVTLIAVTAAGGLIDFRYQVVDPDKANAVIHDINLYPKLVVEKTGATLALRSLPHSHGAKLELGGTYFFMFANAHNAIHAGSLLTMVIGGARLEHIKAQA